ncbi:hypothetical protein SDC9_205408 [bioreactor metagenome]|uniref:Uncharacterized protein n=1 Tax=bioreactor metagenome TaxID=1076179 RepID=A0A645JBF7_9ZZZZ
MVLILSDLTCFMTIHLSPPKSLPIFFVISTTVSDTGESTIGKSLPINILLKSFDFSVAKRLSAINIAVSSPTEPPPIITVLPFLSLDRSFSSQFRTSSAMCTESFSIPFIGGTIALLPVASMTK